MTAIQQWWLPVAPAEGPTPGFLEDFESGLGAYSTVSGASLYSLVSTAYGQSLAAATQTLGTVARIRRTLGAPVTGSRVTLLFYVVSDNTDDACGVVLEGPSLSADLVVVPLRGASVDPNRRVEVTLFGEALSLGSSSVNLSEWYSLEVQIEPGAGNSTVSLTRVSTATVVATGTFAGDFAPLELHSLMFSIDQAPGETLPTRYDNIALYT